MSEDKTPEDLFYEATDYVQENHSQLKVFELIELYGYYKQATCGQCSTEEPSWYKFDASKKWKSWSKHGATSKEEAASLYVKYLTSIRADWKRDYRKNDANQRSNDDSSPQKFFSTGNTVSTLQRPSNENDADDNKTIFDWVKENNVNMVKWSMKSSNQVVNDRDHMGLTLLHWAVDRQLIDMTRFLLDEMGADVNAIDDEGQTALHYAATCQYKDIVELLLKSSASVSIRDKEGLLPYQVTDDDEIRAMLYRA